MASKETLEKKAKKILKDEEVITGVDVTSKKYKERTWYDVYTLNIDGKQTKISGPAWSIALQSSIIKALTDIGIGDSDAGQLSPEKWDVKVGRDRPQLVVSFAQKLPNGKLGRTRWEMQIPHYKYGQQDQKTLKKPDIPTYNRGPFWGRLILKDNSRLVVNAESIEEAKRVLKLLKKEVDPKQLDRMIDPNWEPDPKKPNAKPKLIDREPVFGERIDIAYKKNVVPVRAEYYSKGQLQVKPDWIYRFDN